VLKFWISIGVVISLNAFAGPSLTLAQRWELEKRGGVSDYSKIPKDRHVLFISGIENELAAIVSNYFPDNINAVGQLGLPTSSYAPSSRIDIPANGELVCEKINETYFDVEKPLIVVAHSKGGAETLYCMLKHPELILRGIVDRVVLLQPAVGGSPLADGPPGWILSSVMAFLRSDLETLSTEVAKRNFNQAFLHYEKYFQVSQYQTQDVVQKMKETVSKKIYYVRSAARQDQISYGVQIVLNVVRKYLTYEKSIDGINPIEYASDPWKYSGHHDGLLPVEAQMDPRIGIDLGLLESDHIGLAVSLVSSISRSDRRAFTRAVFTHIYDEPAEMIYEPAASLFSLTSLNN